jgi:ubiquinone/menaquinone biosynthesis C-methylase UbiE
MAERVCPVWVGYLLLNPLRKLFQNPLKILGPHVHEDMTVLDIGCAMGFFSLPLACLVGSTGRVICVDLQERMLRQLERRAQKAGLAERIQTHLCSKNSLGLEGLDGIVDFALAFAVVHEVPDAASLFSEIHRALKPSVRVLMAEPKKRVSERAFNLSLSAAEQNGFDIIERPRIPGSHAVLLSRK